MFARLFSNIGLRSVLNSIGFSMLACVVVFFTPNKELGISSLAEGLEFNPSPLSLKIFFVLCLLFCAFLFNEAQNRLRLLTGNYLSMFAATLASLSLFASLTSEVRLWYLPLALLIIMLLQGLVQKEKGHEQSVFLLSLLSGLLSYLVPEALFIGIVLILVLLISSGLSPKSLGAIPLGFGAATYFIVAIEGWFGINAFESYAKSLSEISAGLPTFLLTSSLGPALWFTLLLISFFVLISFKSRLNTAQRKLIDLWLLLLVSFLLAALLLGNKAFWLSLLLYVLAYALAQSIMIVQNRWLKDGIFLLMILAASLAFYHPWL